MNQHRVARRAIRELQIDESERTGVLQGLNFGRDLRRCGGAFFEFFKTLLEKPLLEMVIERGTLAIMLAIAWPSLTRAQEENAALAIAAKDLAALSAFDRPFMRYVWVQGGIPEEIQATSLTLNYISRATVIVKPAPVSKDVLRIDLRGYAPRQTDLEEWKEAWWNFSFDPRFSLLLTRDTLKFSTVLPRPYLKPGEDVLKLVSPHLDPVAFCDARWRHGQSVAYIVSHRYLIVRLSRRCKTKVSSKRSMEVSTMISRASRREPKRAPTKTISLSSSELATWLLGSLPKESSTAYEATSVWPCSAQELRDARRRVEFLTHPRRA